MRTASPTNHLKRGQGREPLRPAASTAFSTQRPAGERTIREDRSFRQPMQLKVPSACPWAKPRSAAYRAPLSRTYRCHGIAGLPARSRALLVPVRSWVGRLTEPVCAISSVAAISITSFCDSPFRFTVSCTRSPTGVRPSLLRRAAALRIGVSSAATTTSPFWSPPCSAVEPRRNALEQRSDLRDSHLHRSVVARPGLRASGSSRAQCEPDLL